MTGGLIILSLFICRWDVSRCNEIFDELTRQFFRRRQTYNNVFKQFRHLVKCWFLDGCYDVENLEASLKEHFGIHQRMFGYTEHSLKTKVAVTATTISDASPYLFSSYNGVGERKENCGKCCMKPSAKPELNKLGYEHVRTENIENEPHVWEA